MCTLFLIAVFFVTTSLRNVETFQQKTDPFFYFAPSDHTSVPYSPTLYQTTEYGKQSSERQSTTLVLKTNKDAENSFIRVVVSFVIQ